MQTRRKTDEEKSSLPYVSLTANRTESNVDEREKINHPLPCGSIVKISDEVHVTFPKEGAKARIISFDPVQQTYKLKLFNGGILSAQNNVLVQEVKPKRAKRVKQQISSDEQKKDLTLKRVLLSQDKQSKKWRAYFCYDKFRQATFVHHKEGVLFHEILRKKLEQGNYSSKESMDKLVKDISDTVLKQNISANSLDTTSDISNTEKSVANNERAIGKTAVRDTSSSEYQVVETICDKVQMPINTLEKVSAPEISSTPHTTRYKQTNMPPQGMEPSNKNSSKKRKAYHGSGRSSDVIKEKGITNKHTFSDACTYFDQDTGNWTAYFRYDKLRCLGPFVTCQDADHALNALYSKLNPSKSAIVLIIDRVKEKPAENHTDNEQALHASNDGEATFIFKAASVCLDKRCDKWRGYFTHDKKRQIGPFMTREDADLAIEMMSDKLGQSKAGTKEEIDEVVNFVYSYVNSTSLIDKVVEDVYQTIASQDVLGDAPDVNNTATISTPSDNNAIIESSLNWKRNVIQKSEIVNAGNGTIPTRHNLRNLRGIVKKRIGVKKSKAAANTVDATIPTRYNFKSSYISFDKRLSVGRQWVARYQFDKHRYLGGFSSREDAKLALEVVRKKLDESVVHTAHSVDEAKRFTCDILSSKDDTNRYLNRAANVAITERTETSASSSPYSIESNEANAPSTTSLYTALDMNEEYNSNTSYDLPPNNIVDGNNDDNNDDNYENYIPANTQLLPLADTMCDENSFYSFLNTESLSNDRILKQD